MRLSLRRKDALGNMRVFFTSAKWKGLIMGTSREEVAIDWWKFQGGKFYLTIRSNFVTTRNIL